MAADDNGKIVNFTTFRGAQNAAQRGPAQSVTGVVCEIFDLAALEAVAFRIDHGGKKDLFWMSTARAAQDENYRKPLPYETVRVWFNDKAGSLDVFGEKAQGIVEIRNISNDTEKEAFQWFRDNPDGLKPR